MSDALFVSPTTDPKPLPGALTLLPHTIDQVQGGDKAILQIPDTDAVIIDGRGDLGATRVTTRLIVNSGAAKPTLLLIPLQGLSVLTAEWGVTDFIVEDAEPAEWEARLQLMLTAQGHATITGGSIVVDEAAYAASVNGRPLYLTYTEFELLKYLVHHPGRVLTREDLLKKVWGYDYYGGTRTVDVHIRRLRAKLGPEYDSYIGTVRNVGYRFNPQQRKD
ncbi:response regulator transcription factor [Propionibacterium freudenreichii]|uniref:response regulator transcription factor n=1 Tax=Propionibacterium freudenreichii TaxID=1744 RepID=UPI00254DA189|nr:response regulator transcription factor [Propionibacterium freudenreichii]MDK9301758.1 response regulator transcription factor [Propionibacterium freudenreichii]MDK9322096.1 response regulator transcription factor [Propionibacterium freudenreichii]MDK9324308.1 response regulator transcription factor [Propionibacterium freudenreichii]MDK9339868.1 response regulator transcription factor [Propionibacterium freudenreichii]MDK9648547.1 response regulator transcription factor [Propionibacterium f